MLRLHISEYDPPTYRKLDEPRGYKFKPVLLKTGTAVQWGTSSDIVKLESGGVAYLQVIVAEKHAISSTQMEKMNAIFGVANMTKPPIYIAICPDRNSCQEFVLNLRADTILARRTCEMFVSYFEEYQLASATDGPTNNISVKPVPPEHTYNTRKRQRAS
ncbi:unnamed protein product [Phytophthora lilii]|uniref:Unnamed protein product n=1 Tax=Phytophthora lilii TaxID=2077276 RepID=A0A9W7DAW5_9STRA|nr:unnamed protein product [Phytophthora lilii]